MVNIFTRKNIKWVSLFFFLIISISSFLYFSHIQNEPKLSYEKIENLSVETLKSGTGEPAKNGDEITVRYAIFYENGDFLDSNVDREFPFIFILGEGRIISGWQEGMVGVKKGEERRIKIPHRLAYGEEGLVLSSGETAISPKTNLIFEVTVIDIQYQNSNI